jgi:methionyl-tRNA formyltransferase
VTAPLRIVFLGSDAIALPLLESLVASADPRVEFVGVFTQPDRAVGRGQQIQPNAIKSWALDRGLAVFQPKKLTEEVRSQLSGLGADLGLVMAYGHILRDDFIATPRLGMLNLHTSLLPKYRGASPIQTAIACGERETGVTLMRIVRRLDAGPVADAARVEIGRLDTAADVEAKLAAACGGLVMRALPRLLAGTQVFTEQADASATYCRKLEKADGALDFSKPATILAARINGLFPWPACSVEIAGQAIKFGLAEALPGDSSFAHRTMEAGRIAGVDAEGLLVGTADGILRLRRLQRPGGRMLAAAEFLRGFPIAAGTQLPSRPMTELLVRRAR